MTEGDLAVIKRMAIVIDQLFVKNKLFNHIENKFLISDISAGGLGVVFKDRGLTRHFKKDSLCYFEVMLPTSKKAVIGAHVRNVTFIDNTLIKVGFQNSYLDETSKQNYDEYLSIIAQKNSAG
jgi:c-di-GMP-binding flagellar brake protein YcgR